MNSRKMRLCCVGCLLYCMASLHAANDDRQLFDRSQGRSMVISQGGIVATSQTLASQAGAQMLANGGSAVDAAIAANAVLGIVEPMNGGIGGDLFATYWDANADKVAGLNASGWAPSNLTIDSLRSKGYTSMPTSGINTVTVPGCVRGWAELHRRYGKLPWKNLFQPAIYYADHGFPVTEWIHNYWVAEEAKLAADPNARQIYLVNGRPPEVGQVFRNPEYGHALELLADQGESAFYEGAIAEAILKTSARLGGTMTAEDLKQFHAQWVTPISTTYRGWTVFELPPNTQGMAALEMLNIMEQFPLEKWGFASADAFHVKLEAQKLAYADLRRYNGDPESVKVPVERLISKRYAAARAATIDMQHAHCDVKFGEPMPNGNETVYLSAVDKEGNIISLIQSLSDSFGSGIVVDGFGFHLQDRGAMFLLDPSHPDALAPHKRPFHTIIPAFMEKGSVHIGFGIMGGLNQPQAQAQFVSDIVDDGMNIQAAMEEARFTKLAFTGCDFMIEDRVPARIRDDLSRRGHLLDLRGNYVFWMGGGQAVERDTRTRVNFGASDPRKDGAAIPEPAPVAR